MINKNFDIKMFKYFKNFLNKQKAAVDALQKQYPDQDIDLYQNRMGDLLENLNTLMYYNISPKCLEALLKLNKAHDIFKYLDQPGLDAEAFWKISENLSILLHENGQLNTLIEKKPVDVCGAPIPWITYPALEYLIQFDYSDCSIYEFGSGNSTLFWANRANKVVSVETDFEWYELIKRNAPTNVELYFLDDQKSFSENIIKQDEQFHVIVIDSIKYRYSATMSAIKKIAPGGVIIFDNSDWYPNACRFLRDAGFNQIDFHGFGPVNGYAWSTSIFFKEGINLKRKEDKIRPKGGICNYLKDDEIIE